VLWAHSHRSVASGAMAALKSERHIGASVSGTCITAAEHIIIICACREPKRNSGWRLLEDDKLKIQEQAARDWCA
jgi:hypothetical protein